MPLASRFSVVWTPLVFQPSRLPRLGRKRGTRLIRFSGVAGIGVSNRLSLDFIAPVSFCSSSRIRRNSLAIAWGYHLSWRTPLIQTTCEGVHEACLPVAPRILEINRLSRASEHSRPEAQVEISVAIQTSWTTGVGIRVIPDFVAGVPAYLPHCVIRESSQCLGTAGVNEKLLV